MRRVKVIAIGLLAAGLLSAGMAAVFAVGYKSGTLGVDAPTFGRKAMQAVGLPVPGFLQPPSRTTRHYDSILVTLKADAITVPVLRDGRGGGLTSFGEEVLLLTYEGRLFAAAGPDQLDEIDAAIPDNGFDAYLQASESPRFANMKFDLSHHRYNDVLYYDSSQGRGLVISYTEYFPEDTCYTTTIATLPLSRQIRSAAQIEAQPKDWQILYRTKPCLPLKTTMRAMEGHQAGGRMVFKAPSTIYLASGDYGWDGMYAAKAIEQRPEYDYGKVIEIDLATGAAKTFSMGHRNPQGIALDSAGQLWVVEHGPRGGDELNHVVRGGNYGWPLEVLGTMYSGLPVPGALSYGRHDVYDAPVFAWLPSVATSGLDLIQGFYSSWDGDMIMSTLKGESLYRLRIKGDRLEFAEQIGIGKRIRYVLQHTDGRLVLWTDYSHELVFLSPVEQGATFRYLEEWITSTNTRELATKLSDALEGCMECHSLTPGMQLTAPSLFSVYQSEIASSDYAGYTPALRSVAGRWTQENLVAFLSDPQTFAPGTAMPPTGYEDPTVLAGLAEVLAALRDAPIE